MLINYTQARVLVVPTKKHGSQVIVPGVNVIEDGLWADMKDCLGKKLGTEVLPIEKTTRVKDKNGKEMEQKSSDIADFTPDEVESSILPKVASVPQCEKLKKNEGRDSVRKAIMNREDVLKKATAPKASK